MRKIVSLFIAAAMLTSVSAVLAEEPAVNAENLTEIEDSIKDSAINKYIGVVKSYEANMMSVEIDGIDYLFVVAENTPIYGLKSCEKTQIKEEDRVIVFSTSSLLTKDIKPANAVITIPADADEEEGFGMNVIMDTFSKSDLGFISSDQELVLNISEEEQNEYEGKQLLIFYNFMTMSLPAQTSPEAIIVVEEEPEEEEEAPEIKESVEIRFCIGDSIININGEDIETEKSYIADDGVTLVPLRVISESFGADINWDSMSKIITIGYKDQSLILQIDNKTVSINGEAAELEAAPQLTENGFTMVPLRFISENLGADVTYDEETKQVTVSLLSENTENEEENNS